MGQLTRKLIARCKSKLVSVRWKVFDPKRVSKALKHFPERSGGVRHNAECIQKTAVRYQSPQAVDPLNMEKPMFSSLLSNGQPLTPALSELMVPWWSFTKTVLAATALLLVRDGMIGLDERLPDRPDFAGRVISGSTLLRRPPLHALA